MKGLFAPLILLGSVGILYFSYSLAGENILDVLIYLFIVSLTTPILYRMGVRKTDTSFPFSLFLFAFVLKVLGSLGRYWSLTDLYGGVGDAAAYHQQGQLIAEYISNLDFSFAVQAPEGTRGVIYLTGLLYSILPQSILGSYVFFGWLAFIGSILFYRTFRIVFPNVSPSFYRNIIFFLPSFLYWPSSLGKDAWIFFASSFVAYGLGLLFRNRSSRGLFWFIAGIALVSFIRPYVAAFIMVAVMMAYAVTILSGKVRLNPLYLMSFLVLLVIGYFVLSQGTSFLIGENIEETSLDELVDFYEQRRAITVKGGSKIEIPAVYTILGPIYAIATSLLRPFPFEAHNAQSLASSLETSLWLIIFIRKRRVFMEKLSLVRRNPFLAFLFFYVIIMIFAQTTTGNIGIIARQRVQFLPFLWMLF